LTSLENASTDQTNAVVTTFLTLVDREVTRKYIRPQVEFEVILSAFTDANNRGPTCEEITWAASAQSTVKILKSWPGIFYMCAFKRTSIKALVDALLLPFEDTRKQMLALLFEIFRFKAPIWAADFQSALRLTVDYHPADADLLE